MCLSHTLDLSREQRGLGRIKLAQRYPTSHVTRTSLSRSKGQRSTCRGAGAYCGGLPRSLLQTNICLVLNLEFLLKFTWKYTILSQFCLSHNITRQCVYTRQVKLIVLIHTVQHRLLYLQAKFDEHLLTIFEVIARKPLAYLLWTWCMSITDTCMHSWSNL